MFFKSHDGRRSVDVDSIIEYEIFPLDRPNSYRLIAYLSNNRPPVYLLNEEPIDVVKSLISDIKEAKDGKSD